MVTPAKRYQCNQCGAEEEDPLAKPDRLTKGMVLCKTCGGVMTPATYEVVAPGSFSTSLGSAFTYPFSKEHIGWILAVWFGSALLACIPLFGRFFALSVQLAFFFAVLRATYVHRDHGIWRESDGASELYAPALRGIFAVMVAFGPAIACLFMVPGGEALALGLALIGFLLYPSFLIATTVAGSAFMNPVGAVLVVLRFPGAYAMLLVFLAMPVLIDLALGSALQWLAIPIVSSFLREVVHVLVLMIEARMMGLFVREHRHLM